MSNYKEGELIKCQVTAIEPYGAFVNTDQNFSGLIHISEISINFVKDINDYFKIGDIIEAKILEIDKEKSKLKLTVKKMVKPRKKQIQETKLGFNTLKYKLPIWIAENFKKIEKKQK